MKPHTPALHLGLALILSLTPLSANPDAWQKSIQQISEQVKVNPDEARTNQAEIDTCLRTIKISLAANDYNQAISQLNNMRNLEPKAVQSILKLSEQLIDALVQQSKDDITRKEKLYQEFAQSLLSAKQPSDIDPWLKKLNEEVKKDQKQNRPSTPLKLWTPSSPNSPHFEGYNNFNRQSQLFSMNTSSLLYLQSQANQALQIARYWQDYLQYKRDNNSSSARNSMSSISQIVVNFTYIPRSKVLDLQSGLPQKNSQSASIESYQMDDLRKRLGSQEEALLLYSELRQGSSSRLTPVVRELKDKLQAYNSACEYLEGGDVDDGFYKINGLISHPILGSLSRKTHDKHLNRYLRIPKDFKRKDNEEGSEWATRYLLQLSKDHAWNDLYAATSFMQQYYYRSGGSGKAPIKEDSKSVNYLLAGMNYEANQQYMRAIVAYRQAIGTLGYCTEVTTEAGKHLLKLQKAHPTEFAQSQSLRSHDGTSHSFTTSHLLIRKIVQEELTKKDQPTEDLKSNQ